MKSLSKAKKLYITKVKNGEAKTTVFIFFNFEHKSVSMMTKARK